MFVLFDSCWDPFPKLGKQRAPTPGVHNSGWLQSPGAEALKDPTQYPRLEQYVKGVVGAFANDDRILAWDVWNEPDNPNRSSYGKQEPPNKVAYIETLLPKAFEWARAAKPKQPLTSGVWKGDWSSDEKLTKVDRIQLEISDVISFHSYEAPEMFEKRVNSLPATIALSSARNTWLAGTRARSREACRSGSSTTSRMINWGLVAGKTQTNLPWDSWQKPYADREPAIWFHEVFQTDGRPYKQEEVEFIRQITGKVKANRRLVDAENLRSSLGFAGCARVI